MKKPMLYRAMKAFSYITQLGLSVIAPIIICTVVSVWIKNRFDLGNFVVIAGIIIGIGSGFVSMYNFYKIAVNDKDDDGK